MPVDLDSPDAKGETPLLTAVAHGNLDLVAYLLRHGANPHVRNQGSGVFEYAANIADVTVRQAMVAILQRHM